MNVLKWFGSFFGEYDVSSGVAHLSRTGSKQMKKCEYLENKKAKKAERSQRRRQLRLASIR